MSVDLSDKVALITGASRGIGAAVAKAYASAGAHVVLVARTVGALEALDDDIKAAGGQCTLMPSDFNNLHDMDMVGGVLKEKFGRLDILVCNAGMLGSLTPVAHIDLKEWFEVFCVNLGAHFRLIKSVDPLLQEAEAGRAIFTCAEMATKPMAYWGSYCSSKAAFESLALTYAAENKKTNLRVNLVYPSVVDTNMVATAFPGGFPGKMKQPDDIVPAFLDLAAPDCKKHGEVIRA